MLRRLLLVVLLMFFLNISYSVINVSTCMELNTSETYTLNQSLEVNGSTCLNITTSNVSLSCEGYSILGNNTASTYGVVSSAYNSTITNCNISGFQYGVFLSTSDNSTISNTNISSIITSGIGLYIFNGANENVVNNVISTSNVSAGLSLATNSRYNKIENSTFVSGSGLALTVGSGSNNFSNLLVNSSSSYAIDVTSGLNIFNNVTSVGRIGLHFHSFGANNTLNNSNFTTNGSAGYGAILFEGGANHNNTFSNNHFHAASGQKGVVWWSTVTSNNHTFFNNTFYAPTNTLVDINAQSSGNIFYYNNFTNTSGSYVVDANGTNYFNYSGNGTNKGNFWFNVINHSVLIEGSVNSDISGFYYGSGGPNYPYNSTNSQSKVSSGVVDYAPLTDLTDAYYPEITFQDPTPSNNSNLSRNFTELNVSASDAVNLTNITLYLYNSTNGLVNNLTCNMNGSNGSCYYNFTSLTEDTYYLNATAFDNSSNYNSTNTRTVRLDTTSPTIMFVFPTPSNNSNASLGIAVNATSNDTVSGIATINISLYNSTGGLVNSTTCATSPCFVNFTGHSNGNYSFNATVNDTSSNSNNSSTLTVSLDATLPVLSYFDPTPANNSSVSHNFIAINLTATDNSLDTINISLYNSTDNLINSTTCTSSPCFVNFTNLTSANYSFNATVNDSVNNTNTTTTRFVKVDVVYPTASFVSPTLPNVVNVSSTFVSVNATSTDTNLDTINISLYNSSGGLVNSTACATSPCFVNFTGVNNSAKTYYYNATINDSAGNTNLTETRTIILDENATILLYASPTPANGEFVDQLHVDVNVSANVSNVTNITIILSDSLSNEITRTNCSSNGCYYRFSDLTYGTYHYNATIYWSNETNNYQNTSVHRSINLHPGDSGSSSSDKKDSDDETEDESLEDEEVLDDSDTGIEESLDKEDETKSEDESNTEREDDSSSDDEKDEEIIKEEQDSKDSNENKDLDEKEQDESFVQPIINDDEQMEGDGSLSNGGIVGSAIRGVSNNLVPIGILLIGVLVIGGYFIFGGKRKPLEPVQENSEKRVWGGKK